MDPNYILITIWFLNLISKNERFLWKKNINVFSFEEELSNNKKYKTVYLKNSSNQTSDVFIVPDHHYFS